jgi:hypothetical protein
MHESIVLNKKDLLVNFIENIELITLVSRSCYNFIIIINNKKRCDERVILDLQ